MFTLHAENRLQTDHFPIVVDRPNRREEPGLTKRRSSEIVVVVAGHALCESGGAFWPITAGDVFVVGPYDSRAYEESKDLRLINIFFSLEKLHMKLFDLSGLPGYQALFTFESAGTSNHRPTRTLHLSMKELSIVINYAEMLAHELETRSPGFAFMAYTWFMQLVGYLSRVYCRLQRPNRLASLSVANAMNYLETHFDEPVSLDELSRLTHMSKRSFLRAFQAATGHTPIAFLTNRRLARAAEMLRRQEENVTSVALKVGYNDSNYFARRFHAMFGVPPSKYRKRQELL
jgi:AraC-like DNA-binding protein